VPTNGLTIPAGSIPARAAPTAQSAQANKPTATPALGIPTVVHQIDRAFEVARSAIAVLGGFCLLVMGEETAFNRGVSQARRIVAAAALAVRNERVRRVELAWSAAIVAEWAHLVALGVFAYRAGGASAVGVAGLVRLLPAAVVAPRVASLGDRVRRERLLLAALLVGAGALAASAAAAFAHAAAAVYGCAALVGLSATLVRPTLQALLPSLAHTPEELIASNAATSTVESVGTLVGPLLAGIVLARASAGLVFALASAAVAVGAVAVVRVRPAGSPTLASVGAGRRAAGVRTIARHPDAALVIGLMVAQTFVRGCLNVLVVVASFRLLHGGAGAVGYLTAAIGVGGIIGAIAAMTIHGRRLARAFAVSLVFWGLPIALVAPTPGVAGSLVLLAIVGVANSVEDVAGFTLLQRAVRDETLSSVLGLFWGTAMGSVALGSLAAPHLVGAIGARSAFLLVGSLLPVLTVVTFRRLRALDSFAAPSRQHDLIEAVPMFAPLSLPAKEQLANKLIPIAASPGERLIRAGATGDRFYIIDSGSLTIDTRAERKHAHAGDYFGEIALLHDIPRTATVTATTDAHLYALERADFLAAVTGNTLATHAAHAIAEARLATN
jgi:MFS family permease